MEEQKVVARFVDTAEYVGVLRGLVEEGHEVSMLVSGSSMSPFLIHLRDTIYFKKPERPLRAGDMVFYQRDSGQYVMHRILRVRGDAYDIIGDALPARICRCPCCYQDRSFHDANHVPYIGR